MARKRGNFTESYKAEAVKLFQESGQSMAEVARGLGLNETTLGNWVRKAKEEGASGDGEPPPTVQELRRIRDLEGEVRRLNLELAFLKKPVRTSPAKACEIFLHRRSGGGAGADACRSTLSR